MDERMSPSNRLPQAYPSPTRLYKDLLTILQSFKMKTVLAIVAVVVTSISAFPTLHPRADTYDQCLSDCEGKYIECCAENGGGGKISKNSLLICTQVVLSCVGSTYNPCYDNCGIQFNRPAPKPDSPAGSDLPSSGISTSAVTSDLTSDGDYRYNILTFILII
jgi:hypothetical protein